MLSLQSPKILSMYASQRAAQLRCTAVGVRPSGLPMQLGRWLGEQLVRIGPPVAPKPTVGHAGEAA